MNTASVDTPSRKTPGRKSGLSLVRDARPKLLDQLRESLRARHYSRRTEQLHAGDCFRCAPATPDEHVRPVVIVIMNYMIT
jgi:hypothetical protein